MCEILDYSMSFLLAGFGVFLLTAAGGITVLVWKEVRRP